MFNLTGHAPDVITDANLESFRHILLQINALFLVSLLSYFCPVLVSVFYFVVKMEANIKRNVETLPIE